MDRCLRWDLGGDWGWGQSEEPFELGPESWGQVGGQPGKTSLSSGGESPLCVLEVPVLSDEGLQRYQLPCRLGACGDLAHVQAALARLSHPALTEG